MHRHKTILALALAAAMLGGQSGISEAMETTKPLLRLRQAKQRLLNGALYIKPGQAMRLRDKAKKLDLMIADIEAGRPVDEAAVDRAIRGTLRNF